MEHDYSYDGLRVSIGVSGAGKTYGLRQQVYRAARSIPIMVIDVAEEWHEVPAELRDVTIGVRDVVQAREMVSRGARLVIVRSTDIERAAREACAWAIEKPRSDGTRGVCVPEADLTFPNVSAHALPEEQRTAILRWRHRHVALWLDTQRFALLSPTVRSQATEVRLYATGSADSKAVRDYGGHELEAATARAAAILREAQRAGDRRQGAGWHVRIDVAPIPPYELIRERPDGTIEVHP